MSKLPLTERIKADNSALGLKEYRDAQGYEGLQKALAMQPDEIVGMVKEANLRGRGGAGFNTGLKWSFVPQGQESATPKYLVCNADEMEPGTFKDRWLMECDPHQLIEGMIIGAFAIQASVAYLFLRADYNLSAKVLQHAIDEAYAENLLGENILGSGYNLEFYLHTSAGRYICGEETALINSLEGKRATPRAKPPFPQVSGLFGKPTVVNNVETFCNVPHILLHGAEWYQGLGIGEDGGTKLYGVSGKVKNPGCWELPIGTPVREILEEHAGGMREGLKLKGFLPGGGSTDFLTAEHFDLPMDYGSIQQAGSRMGTGTIIVLDDHTCPIGMVLNLTRFFAQESCGWCTPCRDGLPFVRQLIVDIEEGRGRMEDLDTLLEYCGFMGPGNTYCALAPGAASPIKSSLKYFRDDYVAHIEKGCCPYKH